MKIYLDHNATTPIHPEALIAMMPFLGGQFGNTDEIERVPVVGLEFGSRQLRNNRPRRVIVEVVAGAAADERDHLGDRGEAEKRVVVAEEGFPLVVTVAPPGRPQRNEVSVGQAEFDGDDVAGCHGVSVTTATPVWLPRWSMQRKRDHDELPR